MKTIISAILNTNGIFSVTLPKERKLTSQTIFFIGANEDKKNMAGDAKAFFNDFGKSAKATKLNFSI
jgi:hypothetical protein